MARRPVKAFMTKGMKQNTAATRTFGQMLNPNQMRNTGARTATGVLWSNTTTGTVLRSTNLEWAINVATARAAANPSQNPSAASCIVIHECSQ